MRDRGILFGPPMARALREDRKTQTRRAVKTQPDPAPDGCSNANMGGPGGGPWWDFWRTGTQATQRVRCPYGVPGDLLWVREGCWLYGRWEVNGSTAAGRQAWTFEHRVDRVLYENPGHDQIAYQGQKPGWSWRPGIHMPRWASRLSLKIEGVRVERLQKISEADALAEGIIRETVVVGADNGGGRHREITETRFFFEGGPEDGFEDGATAYLALWDSINGPGASDANPWVWVVGFAVHHRNIDEVRASLEAGSQQGETQS